MERIVLRPTKRFMLAQRVNHVVPAVHAAAGGDRGAGRRAPQEPLAHRDRGDRRRRPAARPGQRPPERGSASHARVSLFDVVAAVVVFLEGVHRYNPGKGFQPATMYFLIAAATLVIGLQHHRLAALVRAEVGGGGFLLRTRPFRPLRMAWRDVAALERRGDTVVVRPSAAGVKANLRGCANRGEVFAALVRGCGVPRVVRRRSRPGIPRAGRPEVLSSMHIEELPTPCAVVDLDRLERNCERMGERMRALGVAPAAARQDAQVRRGGAPAGAGPLRRDHGVDAGRGARVRRGGVRRHHLRGADRAGARRRRRRAGAPGRAADAAARPRGGRRRARGVRRGAGACASACCSRSTAATTAPASTRRPTPAWRSAARLASSPFLELAGVPHARRSRLPLRATPERRRR